MTFLSVNWALLSPWGIGPDDWKVLSNFKILIFESLYIGSIESSAKLGFSRRLLSLLLDLNSSLKEPIDYSSISFDDSCKIWSLVKLLPTFLLWFPSDLLCCNLYASFFMSANFYLFYSTFNYLQYRQQPMVQTKSTKTRIRVLARNISQLKFRSRVWLVL